VDFQRHLQSGLEVLSTAAADSGLRLVSEIVNSRDAELMAHFCDVLEVGVDNCYNSALLREVAGTGRCVMLNRHPRMSHEAFLDVVAQLDEYGAEDVILVDNGVRRGDGPGENVLDITGLVRLKRDTRCPVMVAIPPLVSDWSYVTETAVAAVAAGVDGIITDMVPDPCFSAQNPKALLPGHLRALMGRVTALRCTLNAVNLQELQHR
jgi:3-deoxy-7-phosphoheptulonate synthase